MAGNSKSGRKTNYHEYKTGAQLVKLGAEICIQALKREGEFATLETSVLLDLAARFAVKAIPQKLEGDKGLIQIVQVYMPQELDTEDPKLATERFSLEAPQRPTNDIPSESVL